MHSRKHEAIVLAIFQTADGQSEQPCGIHLMSHSLDISAQHSLCSCTLHCTVCRNKAAGIKGTSSKPAAQKASALKKSLHVSSSVPSQQQYAQQHVQQQEQPGMHNCMCNIAVSATAYPMAVQEMEAFDDIQGYLCSFVVPA